MLQIWDLFIRLFHWSLAALLLTAYLSAEWRPVHLWTGYAILVLLGARIGWGLIGSYYARWTRILPTPGVLFKYSRQVLARREPRYLGHNPAGGAMVFVMMAILLAISITGLLLQSDHFWGSEQMQRVHGLLAYGAIALLPLHIAGVIVTGWRHRENLVWSMLTGLKRAPRHGDIT